VIIAFVSIAAVMVVAALAWLIVPLMRGTRAAGVEREASNVAILRDQLAELDNDLASGTVSREQYEQARRELEQRVLEEAKAAPGAGTAHLPSSAGAWTAAVLGSAVPIAAALLYFVLGSHQAFTPQAAVTADAATAGQHDLSPEKVAAMADALKAKLEKEPDNAQGWSTLAHTYYSLKRFPEAVAAYERVIALVPDDANLLADYADALGATSNSLDGKPSELIQRALKIDPTQWKALALAGTVAFDKKDYQQAVDYWERLKATLPPDSDLSRSIDGSIAEAKQLGGIKTAAAAPAPAAAATAPGAAAGSGAPGAKATPAVPGTGITGTVTLSPGLAKQAAPDDTVFIYARAAQGPKFPLAIVRKQVKDLPYSYSLDDSMAMSPEMKMSKFADIVVAARVSKSGNAMPQSGDLEGSSPPVKLGASGVAVVIDAALP
jgi:cytochrome c-type biogenesis protein CcmH